MQPVVIQMGFLILCGIAWQVAQPAGIDAAVLRRTVTTLVYYLLLPALVLRLLWTTPLGIESLYIALSAALAIFVSAAAMYAACRVCSHPRAVTGALLLAASFPNATYMGLPFLKSLYGATGSSIAIQYDLFACTPLLLTGGILTAKYYGSSSEPLKLLHDLLRIPPLWAAAAAILLQLAAVPLPEWLDGALQMLGSGVVPLMLVSVGLSIRLGSWQPAYIPAILQVAAIQLLLAPLVVLGLTSLFEMQQIIRHGIILEAAMPSMVLGLVLCDRFGLETSLYAATVTVTTFVSLFSLPLWYHWLQLL
jgi:predicted permease